MQNGLLLMANGFQRSLDAYLEDKTVAVRLG